jgi:hypothetical protein
LTKFKVMLKYAPFPSSGASAMSGPGRPTLYKPEHASRARELCATGATNPDLAGRFGVAPGTIGLWIATHLEPTLWMRQQNEGRKGRKGRKPPAAIRRVGFVNDFDRLHVRCGGRFAPLCAAETGGNRRKLPAKTLLEKLTTFCRQ